MSTSDDAQREMEQRALRNVRGLVDRIERADDLDARRQRRLLAWLVGGIAIAIVLLFASFAMRDPSGGATVTVSPAPAPAAGSK